MCCPTFRSGIQCSSVADEDMLGLYLSQEYCLSLCSWQDAFCPTFWSGIQSNFVPAKECSGFQPFWGSGSGGTIFCGYLHCKMCSPQKYRVVLSLVKMWSGLCYGFLLSVSFNPHVRNMLYSFYCTTCGLLALIQGQNVLLLLLSVCLGLPPPRMLRPSTSVGARATVLINAGPVVSHLLYKSTV